MLITAFFTDRGTPALLLAPTVTIIEADGTPVISGVAMTETGSGWYRYDFAGYDASKDYLLTGDGGATLEDGDRYLYAVNHSAVDVTREAVAALHDLSAAEVRGQVDAGLAAYDPPTKAEMDAAVAPLSTLSTSESQHAAVMAVVNGIKSTVDSNLDATVSSRATLGTGNTSCVYTVLDGDGHGLAGVTVEARAENDVTAPVIAKGITGDAGTVTFLLESGATYYLWRKLAGYTFTNPDTEVVA